MCLLRPVVDADGDNLVADHLVVQLGDGFRRILLLLKVHVGDCVARGLVGKARVDLRALDLDAADWAEL